MNEQTYTGGARAVVERYEAEQRRWAGRWAHIPEQLPGEDGTAWVERCRLIREAQQREGARFRIANHPELYARR